MSDTYTTPAQDAARIRKTLKGCGISQRQVSVRARSYSMGSSIDVTINDPTVDIREVRNVAQAAEKIDRDERTGEILCGGNRFLSVDYGPKACAAFAAANADLCAKVIAIAATLEPDTGLDVADGVIVMRRGWQFQLEQTECGGVRCWLPEVRSMKAEHVAAAFLHLRGGGK